MPHSTSCPTALVGGKQIDVAPLEIIDLARLVQGEPDEVEKLLGAARSPGFFYLDLRRDPFGRKLLADLPIVYAVSEKYFDQPHELKMKDYRDGQSATQDRGYKMSDCDETFEMAYDELVQEALQLPNSLDNVTEMLKQFSEHCNFACHTMLSCLSNALKLDDTSRFETHHRKGEPSETGLKLIYEPSLNKLADVNDNLHTDSGTFTLLFYDQWGLHIELPDAKQWAFTEPIPGCALINVANSLQRLSENKLCSPQHRVTQPADGFAKRYYISYFLRPEHATKEAWAHAG